MSDEFLEDIDLEEFDIPVFVDENKEIEISIWIGKSKNIKELVYCDIDVEKLKQIAQEDLIDLKEYKIWFKYPSFSDNNFLLSQTIQNNSNDLQINQFELSIEKVNLLIKKWTFPENCNKENIEKLSPIVRLVIGMALDIKLKNNNS